MMRTVVVLVALLGGCGNATLVHRDQTGGVIHLGGNKDKAMDKARAMMAEHCGEDAYAVVSEGEEPIGVEYKTSVVPAIGLARSSATEKTDYRVHYECRSQADHAGIK
jgi:hypothetical protein